MTATPAPIPVSASSLPPAPVTLPARFLTGATAPLNVLASPETLPVRPTHKLLGS